MKWSREQRRGLRQEWKLEKRPKEAGTTQEQEARKGRRAWKGCEGAGTGAGPVGDGGAKPYLHGKRVHVSVDVIQV